MLRSAAAAGARVHERAPAVRAAAHRGARAGCLAAPSAAGDLKGDEAGKKGKTGNEAGLGFLVVIVHRCGISSNEGHSRTAGLGQEDRKTNSAGSAEVTERRRGNCGITVGAMGAKVKSGYSCYADIHRRHECAGWEKTMFLLARYTVAAAVFLSASAANAVEDATPSADYLPAVSMLPACKAFIADASPRDIYVLFEAGRCIGLMQGLGYASRLVDVCPPAEVTFAQKARVAVT